MCRLVCVCLHYMLLYLKSCALNTLHCNDNPAKGERKGSCIISGKPGFQELKDWSKTALNYIDNANKEAVISKHSVYVLTLPEPQQHLPGPETLLGKLSMSVLY